MGKVKKKKKNWDRNDLYPPDRTMILATVV